MPNPKYIKVEDKKYVKFIKSKFCTICNFEGVDPHHLYHSAAFGGNDHYLLPLCREDHSALHGYKNGESAFWELNNANPEWEVIKYLSEYINMLETKK
jgi:hypothetical protein